MIEYLIYALFGVSAALVAFVLVDSAVRFVRAWRVVRRELEKIRDN